MGREGGRFGRSRPPWPRLLRRAPRQHGTGEPRRAATALNGGRSSPPPAPSAAPPAAAAHDAAAPPEPGLGMERSGVAAAAPPARPRWGWGRLQVVRGVAGPTGEGENQGGRAPRGPIRRAAARVSPPEPGAACTAAPTKGASVWGRPLSPTGASSSLPPPLPFPPPPPPAPARAGSAPPGSRARRRRGDGTRRGCWGQQRGPAATPSLQEHPSKPTASTPVIRLLPSPRDPPPAEVGTEGASEEEFGCNPILSKLK